MLCEGFPFLWSAKAQIPKFLPEGVSLMSQRGGLSIVCFFVLFL